MNIKKIVLAVLLALSAAATHGADNVFHLGVARIYVDSTSSSLSSNGPAFLTPQPAGVSVANANVLKIAYTRRLNPSWDFELLLGIPPSHSVQGTGTLAPFGEIACVRQAGPTVMMNYNFGAADSVFRPFAGIGVNFTHFYDAASTVSNNIAAGGPTRISLTNSFGLAAQIGVDYKLNQRWSLKASVITAKVSTDMTTFTGSIERKSTLDLRPVVYSLALGYAF